ncbi:MAG: ATP-dependent RNA helicase RhlE, partial [Methylobacter sp.]
RAGEEGQAISLVSHDEYSSLRLVEKLIGKEIKREQITGFEASAIAPPMPPEPPRGPRPARNSSQRRKPAGNQASHKPRAKSA